jgi:hypothetical protein
MPLPRESAPSSGLGVGNAGYNVVSSSHATTQRVLRRLNLMKTEHTVFAKLKIQSLPA